ncbi:MAG: hypothetical protein QF473_00665 [Planctomycetota bacterium]|nr:hypothetical protein [Planctomycetota bacterium]
MGLGIQVPLKWVVRTSVQAEETRYWVPGKNASQSTGLEFIPVVSGKAK